MNCRTCPYYVITDESEYQDMSMGECIREWSDMGCIEDEIEDTDTCR